MDKEIKRIIAVLLGICLLFIILIGYLSFFQVFRADAIVKNSYNKRLWINEEKVLRGSIIDRNGKILAYSEEEGEGYRRLYNFGRLYSHIIGYSYREYGKVGLELQYNNLLLNISENTPIGEIKNIVLPSTEGNTLKLSLDHHLQNFSRGQMKGKKGAVVLMNPRTGEIYSMVSMPDFDTSRLKEDWNDIMEDKDSPFLNRATSGLYIPGSAFKVVTAAALIDSPHIDKEYTCTGTAKIHGYILKDYDEKGHGKINLEEALVKSCNTYFAEKGLEVGKDKLGEVMDRFMINKNIPFDLASKKSTFPHRDKLGQTDIATAAIGQGQVLVTPLNMAMIASGIANGGDIMKPILLKEAISPEGRVVKSVKTEVLSRATDVFTANELKNMMVEVVKRGTGSNASIKNYRVAGKTGTAENPSGKSHAWFIGFVPADEPQFAIAVVLEEEGSTGGRAAAPIGRNILIEALNNIK